MVRRGANFGGHCKIANLCYKTHVKVLIPNHITKGPGTMAKEQREPLQLWVQARKVSSTLFGGPFRGMAHLPKISAKGL